MSLNLREIPAGAVEIQTGLWMLSTEVVIGGTTYERRELYSSEGYCFYDIREEFYDEEGNVIPEENVLPTQRTYFQYTILGIYDTPDNYVSVPVEDGFNILNQPNDNVVA